MSKDVEDIRKRLYLLGIDPVDLPSPSEIPLSLNPKTLFIWQRILESDSYLKMVKNSMETERVWFFAIRSFLSECIDEGYFPFKVSSAQSKNELIEKFLTSSRVKMLKFFKKIQLLDRIKIRKVSRYYEIEKWGFVLVTKATLKPILDPTFQRWLKIRPFPGFFSFSPLEFSREIPGNTEIRINLVSKLYPTIEYRITCHTLPELPVNRIIPTKDQYINYLDKNIWIPIVKKFKLLEVGLRLF